MQVILPPELELIVSRQLTNGKYQDAIAVIRAAIELLEQQDDIYLHTLSRSKISA